MASRNFYNKFYSGHAMPVSIDLNFIVDSTNSLGIRNLKGPYVQNAFMHTSITPGAGTSNPATPGLIITNPNPASGTIIIQLQDNYNKLYTVSNAIVSPIGTPVTAVTAGIAYSISALGTATAAQWIAVGLPAGLTAAVGMPFVATASATIGGAATAAPAAATGSGVASMELVGDSNLSISPSILAQGFGAQIILEARDYAGALVAPADGSVIRISMLLSNSSVILQGE